MGEAVTWRRAMTEALYGEAGFFRGPGSPGGGAHFRTSARASALFAAAVLRLLVATDDALGQPSTLEVVDIGAGGGHLLQRIEVLAPTYLRQRLRLTAIEVARRPSDLPDAIGWSDRHPRPSSVHGLIIATEWLDNVALDIAEVDTDGHPRYVLVDPGTGAETLGGELSQADAAWAGTWWSHRAWSEGDRVELGAPRDEAWTAAVGALARGLAVTVDYGHMWYDRPTFGTLTGFVAGHEAPPVPDGSRDITAHVAIDAVCAAGEAVAGRGAVLTTQREALVALGLTAERPPLALASRDPAGYVRALAAATEAIELMDVVGLGAHYWVVQPVGIEVPAALRTSESTMAR